MSAPPTVGAIDLHADTVLWIRWLGYDILKEHTAPLPRSAYGGHVDLPRLVRGGFAAQFFGLVSMGGLDRTPFKTVSQQVDLLEAAAARSAGALVPARSGDELDLARREGKVAMLLGLEGAHSLEGEAENLNRLAARGLRYLGLLHFSANAAGFPAKGVGRDDSRGLTPWGCALVERCDALGVIVDLAHVNRKGFFDALAHTQNPTFVSHTGVKGVHDHWRNIDDEQLRAVAARQGAVGIIFSPRFLGRDGVEAVVDHIAHVVNIAGEDTPSLGSDWDGMIIPTRGLGDASQLPNLLAALAQRFPPRIVEKIARANALRVITAVAPRARGVGVWEGNVGGRVAP